jgi:hypothetical protein
MARCMQDRRWCGCRTAHVGHWAVRDTGPCGTLGRAGPHIQPHVAQIRDHACKRVVYPGVAQTHVSQSMHVSRPNDTLTLMYRTSSARCCATMPAGPRGASYQLLWAAALTSTSSSLAACSCC